jgi:dolichol kinase
MAAMMELLPWKLDDNLAIPLTVAAVLWLTGGP